jgi:hypothetical protein
MPRLFVSILNRNRFKVRWGFRAQPALLDSLLLAFESESEPEELLSGLLEEESLSVFFDPTEEATEEFL